MKHRFFLSAALILLAAAGCGAPSHEAPGTQGSTAPRRIVSMSPALTEILFALGLGDRVVGVTDYCDYPPEAATRTHIGGYVNPSVETVLSLHPDLALVSPAAGNRDAALALRRAGVRLEVIPAETLGETYAAIETVARLGLVEERGTSLVRSMQDKISGVASRSRGLAPVRTLFCLQIDPVIAAGRNTLPSELLELAGGTNVITAERYPQIGIEAVLSEAPEVILQARMDAADASAAGQARSYWERWSAIPAVRDHRVFVFDATTSLRPGPRVADAVTELSRLLHGSVE